MGLINDIARGISAGAYSMGEMYGKSALEEQRAQAEMERDKRLDEMKAAREKAGIQAKRTQDMADAKTVQGASDDKRIERAQGIINADTGLNYSPEEVKKIIADPTWTQNYGARHDTETGKPTEWTEGGLINQRTSLTPSTDRTAYQEQMDLSNAAGGIGRTDMQDKYRATADTERKFAGDEAKTAATEKAETRKLEELRIKEKDVDNKATAAEGKLSALFAKIGAKGDGTDKDPAEVKAVQWYIENKDDPVAMEAWDKVHQTKSKNVVSIASDLITRDPNAGGKNALTVDKAWEMASVLYDKSTAKNTGAAKPGAPVPAVPASRASQFKVLR